MKKVVHIPAGLDISIDAEVNSSATPAILTPTSTEMSWDGKIAADRPWEWKTNASCLTTKH